LSQSKAEKRESGRWWGGNRPEDRERREPYSSLNGKGNNRIKNTLEGLYMKRVKREKKFFGRAGHTETRIILIRQVNLRVPNRGPLT